MERSLSRLRKDLWLLQGRHNGAVDRAARKALAAYDEMIAADHAETAAIRRRMQDAEAAAIKASAEPAELPAPEVATKSLAPDTAPGTDGLAPEVLAEPEAVHRGGPMPAEGIFMPEFTDDTVPEGPSNGSGRAPVNGI